MIHIEVVMQVANKVRWGSCDLGGWKMTMQDVKFGGGGSNGKHRKTITITGILWEYLVSVDFSYLSFAETRMYGYSRSRFCIFIFRRFPCNGTWIHSRIPNQHIFR